MWVLRSSDGQLHGPFDTARILADIEIGKFNGDEFLARYPGGEFVQLALHPEFGEALFRQLEVRESKTKAQEKIIPEETIFMPPPPQPEKSRPPFPAGGVAVSQQSSARPKPDMQAPPPPASPPVIELKKIGEMNREEILRQARVPAMVFLIILLFSVVGLKIYLSSSEDTQKINLLVPAKSGTKLDDKEKQALLRAALRDYFIDTFESYVSAQKAAVKLVEGSPLELEPRALLCLIYKELWPFAKQDANDLKAVSSIAQETRSINVISPYGAICEVVRLFVNGKPREARGVIDAALDSVQSFSMMAALYQLKGEALEQVRDYGNARAYFSQAGQIWPAWIKPKISSARILIQEKQYQKAAGDLAAVLKAAPKHKPARLLGGIVEYRGFSQTEKALQILVAALADKERVDSLLESEARLVLAEIYAERGETAKAVSQAEAAYQLNPNNDLAKSMVVRLGGKATISSTGEQDNQLIYLGDQWARQGNHLAAQAEYKAAFELNPKNAVAAMKAAKSLWELNQTVDAIDWLKKAIKSDPTLLQAYILQADYMSQRYDFVGAQEALSRANQISRNNHEVLRGFAKVALRRNNLQEAVGFGERSLRAYDGEVETFTILSEAYLRIARATTSTDKTNAEKRANALKEALSYARRAVDMDSTNSGAHIAYANALVVSEGADTAISYLEELAKKYSYNMEYRLAIAEILFGEERYTQAADIYRRIIAFDEKNKKAHLGLGSCLRAMAQNEEAIRIFVKASVLDPTDAEALFNVGQIYLEMNRFEEAVRQFEMVQKVNKFYPRTNYFLGRAFLSVADFDRALAAALAERQMNPQAADSYILAGDVLFERRKYQECANEYSSALKLRPSDINLYIKASKCYRGAGSLEVAEDMLALAKELESGYAEIYREQGAIFQKKGDALAAIKAYELYLELSPNATDRKEVEKQIRALRGGR
ncbi:MAG: tetratricopeptide repeat protein [Bdellovibrionaceae bacterium]|nr:tetratricopeptide repeat protein [Pseudobdellovibrionaceae bacterium]